MKITKASPTASGRSVVKVQTLFANVALDKFGKSGFINRNDAFVQPGDFFCVVVHANNVVAAFSETTAHDQGRTVCNVPITRR